MHLRAQVHANVWAMSLTERAYSVRTHCSGLDEPLSESVYSEDHLASLLAGCLTIASDFEAGNLESWLLGGPVRRRVFGDT